MSLRKKLLITIACLSVILCSLVSGTIAWLIAETTPIENTFTPSNIGISLTETERDYKMVPGTTIAKDPVVTVAANSEPCWLFVKIEEDLGAWKADGKAFKDYLHYTVMTEWKPLNGYTDVYYREVSSSTAAQEFPVLVNNQIAVSSSVTKGMMDALYNQDGSVNTSVLPTLTFTAYACQREGFDDVAKAWTEASK